MIMRSNFFYFIWNSNNGDDGQRFELMRHEGIEIPPHQPHQMRNDSQEDVEFLVISQPNSRGDREQYLDI